MARARVVRGRPPKPPAERRTEVIRVRFTTTDADRLYRAATRRGRDLADILRECCRRLIEDEASRAPFS